MATTTPLNYTSSLPALAGKKLTLSYSPASQADEDLISSYLPEPHQDGTPITPEELPGSLPAYLIKLIPELRIDGNVVATGGSVTMGELAEFRMVFSDPASGSQYVRNVIDAGEYFGIGLDLGRIAAQQLEGLQGSLEATKIKLEAEDFSGMGKDDLLGDLLYTTALAYFAELDVREYISAQTMGINQLRLPSANLFSYDLAIMESGLTGQALSASPGGLVMDVDHNLHIVKEKAGDKAKTVHYMQNIGMASSALEHGIPELIFSTNTDKAEGISAVKALQLANSQGMPIYTVTADNIATVLPQLTVDADVKSDISNAVNAGKVVTVSKSNIDFHGWQGCGYIIIDPETGDGAYRLSGGVNGGMIFYALLMLALLFLTLALSALMLLSGPIGPIFALFLTIKAQTAVFLALASFFGKEAIDDFVSCIMQGLFDEYYVAGVGVAIAEPSLSGEVFLFLSGLIFVLGYEDDYNDIIQCFDDLLTYFHSPKTESYNSLHMQPRQQANVFACCV